MSPISVEINIDELVLEGFNPADRYKISEAITVELTRLFTAMDHPLSQSYELARLKAGSFQLARDASPERIGTQVAGAIWESAAFDPNKLGG